MSKSNKLRNCQRPTNHK